VLKDLLRERAGLTRTQRLRHAFRTWMAEH
jgi:hypothetical protein